MTRLFARYSHGVGLAIGLLLLATCGSDSGAPPAKTCLVNTDCNNPLACAFGKCHVACRESRDCAAGQRCVKAPAGNVCQLEEEKRCSAAMPCVPSLFCAIDSQCRNNCTTAAECPMGQMCASGACAEPAEVAPNGQLMTGGTAGTGGSPGTGGAPGTGGTPGGVDGGVDAPPGSMVGPCGIPEREPNDMRDQSIAVAAPAMFTSCLGTDEDVDFFELTAPNDPSGGYYQFSITGVAVEVELRGFTASDNGMLSHLYTQSSGQDLHGYLGVSPGQKYRLAVSTFSGWRGPSTYTMKITYSKVDDTYEPNNTREAAKPITLGTPIMAFFHDAFTAAQVDNDDIVDWYTVNVAAGNFTILVENVPLTMEAYIEAFDASGQMRSAWSPNRGANATLTVMDAAAGPYRIAIRPFSVPAEYFLGQSKMAGQVPDSYTRAYKLTVSQ